MIDGLRDIEIAPKSADWIGAILYIFILPALLVAVLAAFGG